MGEKTERRKRFKTIYLSRKAEGHTNIEIFKECGISKRLGYMVMKEISREKNIEYEMLLDSRSSDYHDGAKNYSTKNIDVSSMYETIENCLSGVKEAENIIEELTKGE